MEKNKRTLDIEPKKKMKTYSFKMDEAQYEAANAACKKKYKVPVSTAVRLLIVDHFLKK